MKTSPEKTSDHRMQSSLWKGEQHVMALLEVKDLSVSFTQYSGLLRKRTVRVIDSLDLSADAGEIVAVIGSSGSGKSLLAHAILGILPDNAQVSGMISFQGEPLDAARQEAIRGREIALVPQSVTYLDPLMRAGTQVRAAVRGKNAAEEQRKAFRRYRLSEQVEQLYPFQLSGGMARRVLASTGVVSGARLLVADEPTPGMQPADVQESLAWLRELADQGSTVILITHDIESALTVADKVAVFYAGSTVELARTEDFAGEGTQLRHPYSRALWKALPQNGFVPVPGSQPPPHQLPSGCLFAPRCSLASADCFADRPPIRELRQGKVRCVHAT
jgi:peptide/nickel transport system ATP-binding protein